MGTAQKFMFETSFETSDLRDNQPIFSQGQMETAQQESYRKGFEEGQKELQESIDAHNERQLTTLQADMVELLEKESQTFKVLTQEISGICREVLEKLFPYCAEQGRHDEILAVMEEVFQNPSFKEQEVVFHVAPLSLEGLQEKIHEKKGVLPQGVKLRFDSDSSLSPSDVRLVWGNGGIERRTGVLLKAIEEALSRYGVMTLEPEVKTKKINEPIIEEKGDEENE